MKVTNFFLAVVLMIQSTLSFARTNNSKEIAYALDKIRYEAEVGLISDANSARQSASEALAALKQAGVTDQEIVDTIKDRILDAQVKADFENLMSTLKQQNLSEAEIMDKLAAFAEASSYDGASFRGRVIIIGGATALGLIATYYVVSILYMLSRVSH